MTENKFGTAEIVEGCKQNVIGSKELVYKAFYGYVMGVIIRYVSNKDDAQELANDSFIKIFKHISIFQSTAQTGDDYTKSFKAWIAKITSRTAIDYLRKKKNFYSTEDIENTNHNTLVAHMSHEISVRDIFSLLNRLPQNYKLIFNLYEVEGFSHDEISRMLKISSSSSRVFLGRAKNKLRELYAETFNEERKKIIPSNRKSNDDER